MPHLVLECSSNLPDSPDTGRLFSTLHRTLAESGPFNLSDMKTRLVRHQAFFVAENAANGFVHLELAILAGRDAAVKRAASDALLKVLEEHFPKSRASGHVAFSVEVREMERGSYSKIPLATPEK